MPAALHLPFAGRAAEPLTLSGALEMALTMNPAARSAAADLAAARAPIGAAKAGGNGAICAQSAVPLVLKRTRLPFRSC